jgi:hypothetical protein
MPASKELIWRRQAKKLVAESLMDIWAPCLRGESLTGFVFVFEELLDAVEFVFEEVVDMVDLHSLESERQLIPYKEEWFLLCYSQGILVQYIETYLLS